VKRIVRAIVNVLMFLFGVALVARFATDVFTLHTWTFRILSGLIAFAIASILVRVLWWRSGRMKPDMRRRAIQAEIGMRQGSTGGFEMRQDSGPGMGGGGF
jgi:small neutral amino acid transporter SnatA (MarC family)